MQTICALGALFNMMTLGMAFGFPAILTPALLDPASDLRADHHQTSWLASLSGVSGLIIVFAIGPLMHIYGRKVTHICITLPVLLGWILTYMSYSLPVLFVARLLHSVMGGAIYFLSVCIGELSSPSNRGILLNAKLLFVSFGICIVHVSGYYLHWRNVALVPVCSTIISIIITFFWYETPDWLVSKGRFEQAEKVFYDLRGRNKDSEREIRRLVEEYNSKMEVGQETKEISLRNLKSKAMWRPIALLCCAIIVPEVGGRHFFPSYSIQLAVQISGDKSKGFFYTFVVDGVCIVCSLLSCFLVNRFSRRKLMLYTGFIALSVFVTSAVLIFIRYKYLESDLLSHVILILFLIYFCIVNSSTFAISYVFMGELLPLEYRTVGTVLNNVFAAIFMSGTMKVMPLLTEWIGVHGMMLVFSFCMLTTLLYLHYDLPETKGRTLQDIGNYFKGKSSKYGRSYKEQETHETKDILIS